MNNYEDGVLETDIAVFIVETLLVVGLTIVVLSRYLSFKGTDKTVYFATWLGYFVSFATMILMPVDIAVTKYHSCLAEFSGTNYTMMERDCPRPVNYIPPWVLVIIWNIIYWVTYVATWAFYPLLQSYVLSGEFHLQGKIKQAFRDNLIFYAISFVLCAIIFIILCIWIGGLADALNVAKVASNLWGIGILIALLSYGIIDIPRSFWRSANRQISANYSLFMLAKYNDDIKTYKEALDKTLRLIKKYAQVVDANHENRKYLERILARVTEYEFSNNQAGKKYQEKKSKKREERRDDEEVKGTEYADFVTLNRRLKWDIHQYTTAQCLFDETFKEAVLLEDIITARKSGCTRQIQHSLTPARVGYFGLFVNTMEWLWSHLSPIALRFLAFLSAVMSLTLLFSEVIFFKWPQYSVYAIVVEAVDKNPAVFQIIICTLISYVCTCSYNTIFKIKLFSYYQMIPHQRTDGNSAVFSAANLTRLVAPLCLNFLHLINYINTPVKSPFLTMMTSDPIQDSVFLYFPMILVVIAVMNLFNLGNKVLSLCKVKSFQFSEDFTDVQIDEGRRIMTLERNIRLGIVDIDISDNNNNNNKDEDDSDDENGKTNGKNVKINFDNPEDMFDSRPSSDEEVIHTFTPEQSVSQPPNFIESFLGIFKKIENSGNSGGIFNSKKSPEDKIERQPLTTNMEQKDDSPPRSSTTGSIDKVLETDNIATSVTQRERDKDPTQRFKQPVFEDKAVKKDGSPKKERKHKDSPKTKRRKFSGWESDEDDKNDDFLHRTNYEDHF